MNKSFKSLLLGFAVTALVASGALMSPAKAVSPLNVTVSKTTSLAYAGESVDISVTGIPTGQGVYIFQCATDSLTPRPYARSGDPANKCGSISDGLWLSSPAIYRPDLGVVTTEASASNPIVLKRLLVVDGITYDCATTACSVFVMRDRRNGGIADTTLDSIVPIEFEKTVVPAVPVETLKAKVSNRIAFAAGSSEVTKAVKRELKKEIANYKIASKVTITATAAITTGASTNAVKNLAKKRATAIKKYLVKQGVPAGKIVIKTKIAKSGKKPSTKVVATP